jgi:hypothetical protein
MGVDARIYLPPHAKSEQIFEIALKVLGNEFEKKYFDSRPVPDFEQPSSKKNSWYLKLIEDSDHILDPERVDYFNMQLKDCVGSIYQTLLHLECEDDDVYPICRLLSPTSTPIWAAIGERLVDFFGGKIIYSDSKDWEDPDNYYQVKEGKYPEKKPGQTSDERWYQYYNLLNSEPILSATEIKDIKGKTAYWNERENKLTFFLEKQEAFITLDKELKKKDHIKTDTNKLKV